MRTRHMDSLLPSDEQPKESLPPVESVSTRSSRKRRASNLSDNSQQTASQSTPTSSQNKAQSKRRRKNKAQQTADRTPHPHLVLSQDIGLSPSADVSPSENEGRRVHFPDDAYSNLEDSQPASTTTPDGHRIPRRITISPDTRVNITPKGHGSTAMRLSLPAPKDSPLPDITVDVDMSSLKDDLSRRIQALKNRQAGNDRHSQATELSVQEDMMLYSGHNEPPYQPFAAPSPPNKRSMTRADSPLDETTTFEDSAIAIDHSSRTDQMEQERLAFQHTIQKLNRETSEAKAQNEILSIEIMQLGFGDDRTRPELVLKSIRDSFAEVRKKLQAAMVATELPSDAPNAELLDNLLMRYTALEKHTSERDRVLAVREAVVQELVHESNGLRDRMALDKINIERLEHEILDLQHQASEDASYIASQEASLVDIVKAHGQVQTALEKKEQRLISLDEQIKGLRQDKADLEHDNKDFEGDLRELNDILKQYKESEQKLKTLIASMETEYERQLEGQRDSHQEEVGRLTKLVKETSDKIEGAEADIDVQQTTITELEVQLEQAHVRLGELTQQLSVTNESEHREREAKQDAEKEIDLHLARIGELEKFMELTRADYDQSQRELVQLQELNARNASQREDAEAELDQRTTDNEALRSKLEKHGKEANELRQKLFEAQLASEQAEILIKDRDIGISNLENQLMVLESRMMDVQNKLAEARADNESLQIEQQEALTNAQNQIVEATVQYDTLDESSRKEIASLVQERNTLTVQISEHASQIGVLELQASAESTNHAAAIETQKTEITTLRSELDARVEYVADLERHVAGLERRVEQEAEAMLDLEARKDDQLTELRIALENKQNELAEVVLTAKEYERAAKDLNEEKDIAITNLEVALLASHAKNTSLEDQNRKMEELLKSYVRSSEHTIEALRLEFEVAREGALKQETSLKASGQRVLAEMEALRNSDVVIETTQQVAIVAS